MARAERLAVSSSLRTSLLSALLVSLCALGGAVGCAPDEGDDVDTTDDEVRGGTTTLEHPEVGKFLRVGQSLCTSTLVRPNVVITAAHCYPGEENGDVSARDWQFVVTTADGKEHAYKIDRAQTMLRASDFEGGGQGWRARDIALLHLAEAVPSTIARPASLATGAPYPGEQAALYGYGCTERGTRNGTGTKRRLVYRWSLGQTLGWTSTQNLCPGDSGGPVMDVRRNAVVGTNSGGPANFDYFGNVPSARADIEAVIAGWR